MREIKVGDKVNVIHIADKGVVNEKFGRHNNLIIKDIEECCCNRYGRGLYLTNENKSISVFVYESRVKRASNKIRRIE